MTVTARIRFALAAVILGVMYYYLLVYLVGWMSTHERPGWWVGMFPTRRIGALGWLVLLHTSAVLLAALPIAVAAVIIERTQAVLLALTAAVLATIVAVVPALSSTIWPIIWNSNPILFVTDQAKLIVAVPLIAWVLRAASSNNRFERSRSASSVSQGESRCSG
jgi:hypothetical protein